MPATGGQTDIVAGQAETGDLPPSIAEQLEQPQGSGDDDMDMQHGIAFAQQGSAGCEGDSRGDRLEIREFVLFQGGAECAMPDLAATIGRASCRERGCQYV